MARPAGLRHCTECGTPLPADSRADRRTCSDKCRNDRRTRIKRAQREGHTWDAPVDAETYEEQRAEALMEVLQRELTPVVRENIGEATLDAVAQMLALFPKVVAVLEADLAHPNSSVRHKAAEMLLRYSLSDKNVPQAPKPPQKVELVGMPSVLEPAVDAEVVEPGAEGTALTACNRCGQEKPPEAFEANAPRCRDCQKALRAELGL